MCPFCSIHTLNDPNAFPLAELKFAMHVPIGILNCRPKTTNGCADGSMTVQACSRMLQVICHVGRSLTVPTAINLSRRRHFPGCQMPAFRQAPQLQLCITQWHRRCLSSHCGHKWPLRQMLAHHIRPLLEHNCSRPLGILLLQRPSKIPPR